MAHCEFEPRKAVRADKREAWEAVGRSFCKTLAELITNSDTSAKHKHGVPHASGLLDLMFSIKKGTQLDSATRRSQLEGRYPKRTIVVELVRSKKSDRPKNEVVVVDSGSGMSAMALRTALEEIEGDRSDIAGGRQRRGIFGKGLSDVLRAHEHSEVQTYDGRQLTIAQGAWRPGWTITMDDEDNPTTARLKKTRLDPTTTGTAVSFRINDRAKCSIPKPSEIVYRLANFYMLRLIASDPNVALILRQHHADKITDDPIAFDFPVGQVIESCTEYFESGDIRYCDDPLRVDFLVVRADSERPLRGLGSDKDARENGMLIVDDHDAVYDVTFADPDYERADFLSRFYGVVRVHGLRDVCDRCLNDPDAPTSPVRDDRDGFNINHGFSRALLAFISERLKPIYERERERLKEQERSKYSGETKKRIDDALKHLNKYFHDVTQLGGTGIGTETETPDPSETAVSFFPQKTKLVAGRNRNVLLLVHEDCFREGAEVVATASDGLAVQPETERLFRADSPRWSPHKEFFAVRFEIVSNEVGISGAIDAIVEGKDGDLLAELQITDVLDEAEVEVPETLEFRPTIATGRPGRRNNLVLYVNRDVVPVGRHVRVAITGSVGYVRLIGDDFQATDRIDIKLKDSHLIKGQKVFRVLIPWRGTSWNQHAKVMARVKVGGPKPLKAVAKIRLDEPEDGGFFKEVKYDDLGKETLAPSKFAAGVITINAQDSLNALVFGDGIGKSAEDLKVIFDSQLRTSPLAQQRVAHLLLEEASFRALEDMRLKNRLHFQEHKEVSLVHEEIDKYKYKSAAAVHRALVRST